MYQRPRRVLGKSGKLEIYLVRHNRGGHSQVPLKEVTRTGLVVSPKAVSGQQPPAEENGIAMGMGVSYLSEAFAGYTSAVIHK